MLALVEESSVSLSTFEIQRQSYMNQWICAAAKIRQLCLKHATSFSGVLCKPVILQLQEGFHISNTKHGSEKCWRTQSEFRDTNLLNLSQEGFLTNIKRIYHFKIDFNCTRWWKLSGMLCELFLSENTDIVTHELVSLFCFF